MKKEISSSFGDLIIKIECEECESKYLDSKVTINGVQLCCISWPERIKFIEELEAVISKHRI